jgi:hypothetical protein
MTKSTEGIQMQTMVPTWKYNVFPDVDEATLIKAYLESMKAKIAEEVKKAQEADGKVIVEIKFDKGRY